MSNPQPCQVKQPPSFTNGNFQSVTFEILIFHKKTVISVILYYIIYMLLMLTTHCRSRDILCGLKPLENSSNSHFLQTLNFQYVLSLISLGTTVIPKRNWHQRTGRGGWGGCSPPCQKKNSIIRAKLMYRSGKDTVKNILLFNILIYLFSSHISPNLLTDLCTTSRDGCYYSELEH